MLRRVWWTFTFPASARTQLRVILCSEQSSHFRTRLNPRDAQTFLETKQLTSISQGHHAEHSVKGNAHERHLTSSCPAGLVVVQPVGHSQ